MFKLIALIKGNGFSSISCENEILIGAYSCPIISNSATQLVCRIGFYSGLIAGVNYNVDVNIKNSGIAMKSSVYFFNFIPIIHSITPNIGNSQYCLDKSLN